MKYFTNESLITFINEIKSRIATKVSTSDVDDLNLIETTDIDTICGGAIQVAALSNEVTF